MEELTQKSRCARNSSRITRLTLDDGCPESNGSQQFVTVRGLVAFHSMITAGPLVSRAVREERGQLEIYPAAEVLEQVYTMNDGVSKRWVFSSRPGGLLL